jgi:MoaA/NifB/PqqE/SkfB family radical SAM enzyme
MSARSFLRKRLRRSTRFPGFRLRERSRFLNVRMDTTNRCNLRCTMCPMRLSDLDPHRSWHDMEPDLFARIAAEVFPLAKTVSISCGAEPLCNPRFEEYLAGLYSADVPEREMVTNGLLLTRERSAAILACPPTSIFVSIDGATPRTHAAIRGGCSLETVLGNLEALLSLKGRRRFPMLSFSTTLQAKNLDELPDIARLAGKLGATSLCVVPLVPYSGLDTGGEAPDLDSPAVQQVVREAERVSAGLGVGFSISTRADRRASDPCPYAESWVYIDPDGLVDPCPYWNTSNPLGDLKRQSFGDIWGAGAYRALRELSNAPSCRSCPEIEGTGRAEPVKTTPGQVSREAAESHEVGHPPDSPLP